MPPTPMTMATSTHSDAIALFDFLFLGGALPPGPGPVLCGLDATDDALTCEAFAACPYQMSSGKKPDSPRGMG